MPSLNRVTLIGNVGRDPEDRVVQSGSRVVNFSMATTESWKDRQSGERRERVEWHRIVIWNEHLCDVAEKYVRKGTLVYVEGALKSRKYTDKGGVERVAVEIVLSAYGGILNVLADGARGQSHDNGDASGGYGRDQGARRATAAQSRTARDASNARNAPDWNPTGNGSDLDDEIPF